MTVDQIVDKKNLSFKIFTGSWCPVCTSAMPEIAKFLQDNGIEEKVEMVDVNPSKTQPEEELNKHKVNRVPTVVAFSDNEEVARITEFAPLGWYDQMNKLVQDL